MEKVLVSDENWEWSEFFSSYHDKGDKLDQGLAEWLVNLIAPLKSGESWKISDGIYHRIAQIQRCPVFGY